MIELVTRIVEAGPPLHCEDCGTNLVTLREDDESIEIGCPACDPEYRIIAMVGKLDAALESAQHSLIPTDGGRCG